VRCEGVMIVTENRFDVRCECSGNRHKKENGQGVLLMKGVAKQTYLKVKLTPDDAQSRESSGKVAKFQDIDVDLSLLASV
jgi:hypothetical protein